MVQNDFIEKIKEIEFEDEHKSIYDTIWGNYERVVFDSLITSFGLDAFIKDQKGGDVDTIYNVQNLKDDNKNVIYKSKANEENYKNRGEYNSDEYHQGKYIDIARKIKGERGDGIINMPDAYSSENVVKYSDVDIDHVIAAKTIHDDPARVLAGLKGTDLANCESNLKPTHSTINRSMKDKPKDEFIKKWEEEKPERQRRIQELESIENRTDKERKQLDSLKKKESIDSKKTIETYNKAKNDYNEKVNYSYYTSKTFALDTIQAASKRGIELGCRQALGFVLTEVWFVTKEELDSLPAGRDTKEFFIAVGIGIQKGFESATKKYEVLIRKYIDGIEAGVLTSLTTTLCNIFFTTAENFVKVMRQLYASIVQAGKVIFFNPDNLYLGDRIKTATIIMATGASVLVGTTVGDAVRKTPIANLPEVGEIVPVFCSTLVSGMISCTLLLLLDKSKFINDVVYLLNEMPCEVNNYKEIADIMERLFAKLENIDIDQFKEDTQKYDRIANMILSDELNINEILLEAYDEIGINIPWNDDFDTFMANKNNSLKYL